MPAKVTFESLIIVPKRSTNQKCFCCASPLSKDRQLLKCWRLLFMEIIKLMFTPLDKFPLPIYTGRSWPHIGRKYVRMYSCH